MQARQEFALRLARDAGAIVREGYGKALDVNHKGAIDLVTDVDLRSEQFLVESIRKAFPEDSILAEEGERVEAGERCWLVDPLDGTTNFAHGLPFFSVSIACMVRGEPHIGVVFDPMRDELFHAFSGSGAWLNGNRIAVSAAPELENSLLVTGFPYDIRTNPDNNLDHYNALALRSQGVRRLGSAALDLCYVAAGRLDGYWELRLNPWDWAAGVLIVRQAGGQVTTFSGDSKVLHGDETLIASNGLIHEALMKVLNESKHR
jgi:myo-inositol-1(or 4)-monophosphatase